MGRLGFSGTLLCTYLGDTTLVQVPSSVVLFWVTLLFLNVLFGVLSCCIPSQLRTLISESHTDHVKVRSQGGTLTANAQGDCGACPSRSDMVAHTMSRLLHERRGGGEVVHTF